MGGVQVRPIGRGLPAAGAAVAFALACTLLAASGCSGAVVDESSPQVADVQLSASSDMTEASQRVEIRVEFDQAITATGDVADDFVLLVNGEQPDSATVQLDVLASAQAVTFTLRPADGVTSGPSSGSYFALYAAQFSLAAASEDGALPSIVGTSGSCAVLADAIEGTLPSGLAIEVLSQREGSQADGIAAQTVVQVSSPALARVITWFSPDGGTTKLVKHNHNFATADASNCAADIASVVNDASGLGLVASASGDTVTLTATSVADGQVIEPVIVEGVGVAGGSYDADDGTGEEQ